MLLLGKLNESITKIRISWNLNKNYLIEQNNQGFYEEKHCFMNKAFEWLNSNTDGDDQGHSNYLGFQKPFD